VAQKKAAAKRTTKASTTKSDDTKVTRITATETKKDKKPAAAPAKTAKKESVKTESKKTDKKVATTKEKTGKNPVKATGGYFKGAWNELREVRWPTRRTTWGLTLAVLIFSAFFVALIVLLDLGFQWVFEQILG
jgi:preprotein translocase subunit SecE